jgi:hypothetical protein
MLLDRMCKRAPAAAASRAVPPPPPAAAAGAAGPSGWLSASADYSLSSAAASQQIADDIARRCVFDKSPRHEATKLERKICPEGSLFADTPPPPRVSPSLPAGVCNTASSAGGDHSDVNCRRRQVPARSPVVPQLRLSECGLGGSAVEGQGVGVAGNDGSQRPPVVSAPRAGAGGEGEDDGGAAEVRRVFLPRSDKLQEMERGVKEATDLLAEAAAARRYEIADRWSKETKERRVAAHAFAEDLLRELAEAERVAVAKGHYATAQACKTVAATVDLSIEGLACSPDSRDPIAAMYRRPGLAAWVLLELAQQHATRAWTRVPAQSRRRYLSLALALLVCLGCSSSMQACLECAVGWMWMGAVGPLQGAHYAARHGYHKALVWHACSFASTHPSHPSHAFSNMAGATGWRNGGAGGDKRGKEERIREREGVAAGGSAGNAFDGPSTVATLARQLQFVAPFVLVAIGATLLEAAVFSALRLSVAQEWGMQGPLQMTVLKYLHMALVFVVGVSGLHPFAALLTFALPLSAPLFHASNLAGKLCGCLLQATVAWVLWARDVESPLGKWIQNGGAPPPAGWAWRILHTAMVPSLSPHHLRNLAELEATCRLGVRDDVGVPGWVADGQVAVGSALVGCLPVAVASSVGVVAVCRMASSQMAALGGHYR